MLYPYVYLLARTAFLERASGMLEVGALARALGPWSSFLRVSLPLARPAIAAGAALALMETLADYGTVSYFAVQTFTTGIYRAWFSLGDRVAAAQLSAGLLGFVVLVLLLERLAAAGRAFTTPAGRNRPTPRRRLHGRRARCWPSLVCLLPMLIGFLLPAGAAAASMALTEGDAQFGARFLQLAAQQLHAGRADRAARGRAGAAAGLCRAHATAAACRVRCNRLVGLGYAVPGSVIAVGVLIPVTRLDNWLAAWMQDTGRQSTRDCCFTGGIAALVYAYLVRFLAVALQTVEASLAKITPSMDDAARSLGLRRRARRCGGCTCRCCAAAC